jgi:hypothetical protein
MKFLNNLDLQSNELQNAVIQNYAGNPDGNLSGTEGQIVYSTTVDAIFINTDSSTGWDRLATGSTAVASVTAGDSSIVVGGTSVNPTISHADTSSVSDLTAASRTYVDGITFDTYGHVQTISTSTESVVDTTYDLSLEAGAIIRLQDNGGGQDDITIVGAGGATLSQAGSTLTITTANDNSIDYVNAASWNSTNGELTLSGVGNAGVTVDLDGRYLTSFTESNDYGTIAVSGQTSVAASSVGDTVTFVGAGGMTITTGTDEVTFTSANDNDIDYISGATFSSGTLNLTGVGNAGASISLDGRYLQSYTESDTLDSVTGRGATTTNAVTVGDLTVNGDLTVSGNHIVTLAEEVRVEDSLFILNHGATGSASEDAGFLVERGSDANVGLIWEETSDVWSFISTSEIADDGDVTITAYTDIAAKDAAFASMTTTGQAVVGTVNNAGSDYDRFLVTAADGTIEYRTGAQLLSDIGAGTGSGNMSTFNVTDGTNSTSIGDGDNITIGGTGLISVTESSGAFTISTTANNYSHPTQTAINASGTGATVVDGVTVNTLGHTTAVSTRTLALLDLGYSGATDANNYVLPAATEAVVGGVELATTLEAAAGTDSTRAITAAGLDAYVADRKHKASIGDGTNTAYTVTHNLNTTDVIVQLFDVSSGDTVYADVVRSGVNAIEVSFGAAPASNDVRVLIQAI